jgi:transcriptional regulator with XRE-family HTH domain
MSVTQEMIAKKVKLDRSTVSKILNGRASDFVSRKTIERVLDAARGLGYDFTRLRHTHSRQFERTDLRLDSEFDIILSNGDVYDSGRAIIRNISEGSALISELTSSKSSLPMKPFTISLIINGGGLKGVSVLGRVTRLEMKEELELALKFVEVSPVSAKKLQGFMDKASVDVDDG